MLARILSLTRKLLIDLSIVHGLLVQAQLPERIFRYVWLKPTARSLDSSLDLHCFIEFLFGKRLVAFGFQSVCHNCR